MCVYLFRDRDTDRQKKKNKMRGAIQCCFTLQMYLDWDKVYVQVNITKSQLREDNEFLKDLRMSKKNV